MFNDFHRFQQIFSKIWRSFWRSEICLAQRVYCSKWSSCWCCPQPNWRPPPPSHPAGHWHQAREHWRSNVCQVDTPQFRCKMMQRSQIVMDWNGMRWIDGDVSDVSNPQACRSTLWTLKICSRSFRRSKKWKVKSRVSPVSRFPLCLTCWHR